MERLRLNPLFRVHTVSAAIFGRLSVGYSTFKAEFLTELAEKHDVEDALFLVDDADDLIGGLRRKNYSYRVEQHGFRNSIERVFREVERRTSSFSNCFSHVDPPTAETWLQAHAVWWNHA